MKVNTIAGQIITILSNYNGYNIGIEKLQEEIKEKYNENLSLRKIMLNLEKLQKHLPSYFESSFDNNTCLTTPMGMSAQNIYDAFTSKLEKQKESKLIPKKTTEKILELKVSNCRECHNIYLFYLYKEKFTEFRPMKCIKNSLLPTIEDVEKIPEWCPLKDIGD